MNNKYFMKLQNVIIEKNNKLQMINNLLQDYNDYSIHIPNREANINILNYQYRQIHITYDIHIKNLKKNMYNNIEDESYNKSN